MKILTAEEMRTVDRVTTEQFGVASIDLMHRAGTAVATLVLREFPERRQIAILCGKGNNGGDGFVAARRLAAAGCSTRVLLLGNPADLNGDARATFEAMAEAFQRLDNPAPVFAPDEAALASPKVHDLLTSATLLIDAVVGTGFKPPLRGVAAALRDRVNALKVPVVAVDLPSGWDADSRAFAADGAFRASAVVTFTAPKLAHMFGNLTGSATGPIVVAPIGSPEESIESATNLRWSGASKSLTEQPRSPDSNKGLYGHVLIAAGGRGKSGAPAMASLAALRAGAGLVTAAVPESILASVAAITPELMTLPLREGDSGEIGKANLEPDQLRRLTERATVIAMGPGMGPEPEEFVLGVIEKTTAPLVLDADALNIIAKHLDKLNGHGRTVVLTPHPGEMARLAGLSTKEVQANREPLAREFARKHNVTVVLKGWRTLIAHPDGRIAINTTGNPGMAKGGSGDILTGIVAALLAQHPENPEQAVEAAVYLHGLAADFALGEQDEHTLLATDTVGHLFRAFHFRSWDEAGYVWLEGLPSPAARPK
ncbi:MAG TPA: NAD(P)H-hydrate dehydratase [Acidobacteriaceae bacterium]|jgi:NAD(P)H-hydrate epimerase|nr:NAD(P)H-hydrate dehydratase [Acidobacteriaceae bacterium]